MPTDETPAASSPAAGESHDGGRVAETATASEDMVKHESPVPAARSVPSSEEPPHRAASEVLGVLSPSSDSERAAAASAVAERVRAQERELSATTRARQEEYNKSMVQLASGAPIAVPKGLIGHAVTWGGELWEIWRKKKEETRARAAAMPPVSQAEERVRQAQRQLDEAEAALSAAQAEAQKRAADRKRKEAALPAMSQAPPGGTPGPAATGRRPDTVKTQDADGERIERQDTVPEDTSAVHHAAPDSDTAG